MPHSATPASGLAVANVDRGEKQLRSDAARNRQLVLDAAAQAFAEHGIDVGYEQIARRAGVGVGTVYRRFPQRSELVLALFESRVEELVALSEAALEQPDGLSGLRWFLEQFLAGQMRDRGLHDVVSGNLSDASFRGDERVLAIQGRIEAATTAVLRRAQSDQTVRSDVEASDIGAVTMIIGSMSTGDQPELWRRYLTLFLDALAPRRTGSSPLPLTAPVATEMADLLHGRRRSR